MYIYISFFIHSCIHIQLFPHREYYISNHVMVIGYSHWVGLRFFFFFFLVVLSLCHFAQAFSSCGMRDSRCDDCPCCIAQAWGLGFSSCNCLTLGPMRSEAVVPGSRVQAPQLWMRLVPLQYVGSSPIRDRTRVSFLGRQVLIHCTTREVR